MSDVPLLLPDRPDLNWLRNCAKDKLRHLRVARPSATLAEAQRAVAREYGFSTWQQVKERVEQLAPRAALGAVTADVTQAAIQTVVEAIRRGDVEVLKRAIAGNASLAKARLGRPGSGGPHEMSLLHVATDWPGHYPRGPETVALLIAAGADVNARYGGPHTETPLHWAASSDDVAVLDILLDHGADINASGAVIGGGTPLSDATAFGQWRAARRLVERGAKAALWEAAALGLLERVEGHFAGSPLEPWPPAGSSSGDGRPGEVTHAFWCACHGGQLPTAIYLLARGADIHWLGHDRLTPLGAARRAGASALVAWLIDQGAT
jgi:hypothetical protein